MKLAEKSLAELLRMSQQTAREIAATQDRLLTMNNLEEIRRAKRLIERLERESDAIENRIDKVRGTRR